MATGWSNRKEDFRISSISSWNREGNLFSNGAIEGHSYTNVCLISNYIVRAKVAHSITFRGVVILIACSKTCNHVVDTSNSMKKFDSLKIVQNGDRLPWSNPIVQRIIHPHKNPELVCDREVTFFSYFKTEICFKDHASVYSRSFEMNQQHTYLESQIFILDEWEVRSYTIIPSLLIAHT